MILFRVYLTQHLSSESTLLRLEAKQVVDKIGSERYNNVNAS
jgi:hypothetical protein